MSLTIESMPITGLQVIQRYGNGKFSISNETFNSPVIVTSHETFVWHLTDLEVIKFSDFSSVIKNHRTVEILLFGSGKVTRQISPEVIANFGDHNIKFEVMGTGAACRSYNVLLSEGREVAAALLPIE